MPQFDIFSFSSQLFWVFLMFSVLYFSLTYYLLPAVSITLKIRKRKLLNVSDASSTTQRDIVEDKTLPLIALLSNEVEKPKLVSLFSVQRKVLTNIVMKTTPFEFQIKIQNIVVF